MEALKILLVEDNDDHAAMIQRHLKKSLGNAFRCVHEGTLEGGLKRLDVDPIDVILLDLRLPDSSGVETLPQTFAKAPTIPIVILTSIEDRDLATRRSGLCFEGETGWRYALPDPA